MRLSHRAKLAHKRRGFAKGVFRRHQQQVWRQDLARVCVEVSVPPLPISPLVRVAKVVERMFSALRNAGAAQAKIIRGQF